MTEQYKIGNLRIKSKAFLAPMAAVNNVAFRLQCHNFGAGLVYSQMIDEDGFLAKPETFDDFIEEERPVVAQLVGRSPEKLADCAKTLSKKVDMIDINFGCPDNNVVGKKCGAYHIKHPNKIKEIIASVKGAVKIPVTAKIRIGWDDQTHNHLEVAKLIEEGGADAVAVHGRVKTQGYSGKANWAAIKQVKKHISLPVIGNGDVKDAQTADAMIKNTGCDFIMIGRAAMGNPFIFREINDYLEHGVINSPPSKDERIDAFLEFLKYYETYCRRDRFPEIRQQAMWYLQDFQGSKEMRVKIRDTENTEQLLEALKK